MLDGVGPNVGGYRNVRYNSILITMSSDYKIYFHHELFHQADLFYHKYNKNWNKLRKYQNTKITKNDLNKKFKGFARGYGKTNIFEDKATMAEAIITDYQNLSQRIKSDTILKQKVELMLKAYYELSNGKMNRDFWIKKFGFYILD